MAHAAIHLTPHIPWIDADRRHLALLFKGVRVEGVTRVVGSLSSQEASFNHSIVDIIPSDRALWRVVGWFEGWVFGGFDPGELTMTS